jgi:hypothetical protein
VHFGASGAQNVDALFFMHGVGLVWIQQTVRWDTLRKTCVFASGGICGSRSAIQHIQGTKCRCTIFHALLGLVQIPQKAHRDTLCQTFVFASGRICGSRTAFQCVRGVKHQCTFVFVSGGMCGSCSAFRCVRAKKCQRVVCNSSVGPVPIP